MSKKIFTIMLALLCAAVFAAGCGSLNTVETCVVANSQYTDKAALETAKVPDTLAAGKDIYASIRVIESPEGMEYTGKWTLNGSEVKTETIATKTDKADILVYRLDAQKAVSGKAKLEIFFKKDLLLTKEFTVQ